MTTVRYTTIDGEVIAEKRNGSRRLYVPDPLGSTVALLDNTQAQVDMFTYWPYGEVRTSTGTTPPPFQFVGTAGYYTDGAGRIYIRARYLSTQKDRWLTQDPIWFDDGDWNLYRYVGNSPVTSTDSSGLSCSPQPPTDFPNPTYGRYCGPNVIPGKKRPIDPLDECCKQHDECFAAQKPPCTWQNQKGRKKCLDCTIALCNCAVEASCDVWSDKKQRQKCEAAKVLVLAYCFNQQKNPST